MNAVDLKRILRENNINEAACPINPPAPLEGALCLFTEQLGGYHIRLNERGQDVINETLDSEDAACKRFLKLVLSDPTYRSDFQQKDLIGFRDRLPELLRKYGLHP